LIFDRFFTAARQITDSLTRPGGSRRGLRQAGLGQAGLGLAIVRQIVESHDGTVAVHSTMDPAVGPGSTFVLWLPDHTAEERSARPPATNPLPLSARTA
jgi:signal transduction histidine kinase